MRLLARRTRHPLPGYQPTSTCSAGSNGGAKECGYWPGEQGGHPLAERHCPPHPPSHPPKARNIFKLNLLRLLTSAYSSILAKTCDFHLTCHLEKQLCSHSPRPFCRFCRSGTAELSRSSRRSTVAAVSRSFFGSGQSKKVKKLKKMIGTYRAVHTYNIGCVVGNWLIF